MGRFRALGALMGAGLLTFAVAGAALAGAPTYTFDVTKTADPATVPVGGASVTFTISVHNTGTGFFQVINVADDMVGCTPAGPVTDAGSDGNLTAGETWDYTCTVAGVMPDTTNTATVDGCHDGGGCNQASHDFQAQGQVTVGLCESNCVVPPTPTPAGNGNGATGQPLTDTAFTTSGTSGPSAAIWLFVIGLGVLLGSVVVLRPSRVGRHR
ncbi:MAG TPA: hypothetical protein VNC22_11950 [Sporichthya sp.]|jgi:hypothetical protein|nr:hypothetical protein [Sporichthya sp.]